jgi:lipoprotein-anchoring transpeptidase ErfK/SrfK
MPMDISMFQSCDVDGGRFNPTRVRKGQRVSRAIAVAIIGSSLIAGSGLLGSAASARTVSAQTTSTSTSTTFPGSSVTTSSGVKVSALTIVASAKSAITPAYESATSTKPFISFNNKTNFSGRHVFIVLAQQGDSFKVQLPMRPNGRTGFVKAKDVNLYQHDYAAVISLTSKTLTLYKSGKEVSKDTVAVGSAKYPTPTGSFYMRELARPRNPNGAYGPWAFGLSGYSNVLQKFGRGDGQIGIHGTNEPKKLGQNVSHGCVRMSNASITKLAKTLPQGVPVEIVA